MSEAGEGGLKGDEMERATLEDDGIGSNKLYPRPIGAYRRFCRLRWLSTFHSLPSSSAACFNRVEVHVY